MVVAGTVVVVGAAVVVVVVGAAVVVVATAGVVMVKDADLFEQLLAASQAAMLNV